MSSARWISRLNGIDWDFAGSPSESAFSAIHWHPGRFASQLPATLIGVLSSPGDLVLDPFVGSGTTLVEAQRLGRRSMGIDLNPISCLIARAKTLTLPACRVEELIADIKTDARTAVTQRLRLAISQTDGLIPSAVQGPKWYTRAALQDLASLWRLVCSYKRPRRLIAEAAFSSILLPVCRETRHWGYVCDNSSPIEDHEGDPLKEFVRTLERLRIAYRERDDDLRERFGPASETWMAEVICGLAGHALMEVPDESVDLVVTSPPYFGVCDYVKAQRLSMEWFGEEIEPLRRRELGARSKRHRVDAREAYLHDLSEVLSQLKRVLRKAGMMAIIMGESRKRDAVLADIRQRLGEVGLRLELDVNRRVSSQRRQAPSIKGEHVFVLSL
jgi:DNA modification methylase